MEHLVRRQEQIDYEACTLQTCSIETDSALGYVPSLGGNVVFIVIFALLIPFQVYLGIRHRTWGYMAGLIGGLILEIIGYVARVQANSDPFGENPFLMQIVTLTIGPAFLSAAVYLCLGRIIVVYGEHFSRLKPRTYSVLFISCDVLALVLQAIGGGIASSTDIGSSTQQTGINIMIAGLATQVASMFLFLLLSLEFAWRAFKNRGNWAPALASLRQTVLFKAFLWGLVVAFMTIFVRSVFRVAELSEGYDSELAQDEVTFMILEGAMIAIACILLTVFHPGIGFQGQYASANFPLRTSKKTKEVGSSTPDEMTAV